MDPSYYKTIVNFDHSYSNDVTMQSTCSTFPDGDQTLFRSKPFLAIYDHNYSENKIYPTDWIKREPISMEKVHGQQVIEVNGQGFVKSLARSIEETATNSETINIKLKPDRSSIKLLRKSLKIVEQSLKDTDPLIHFKWRLRSDSFINSIQEYEEIHYAESTGESESEGEGESINKFEIKPSPRKKIKQTSYSEEDTETDERETKKILMRCRYKGPAGKNIWMFCGNFFRNGYLIKSEIPKSFPGAHKNQIDRRIVASKRIKPDPEIFAHVNDETPWEESDWGPLLDRRLSKQMINRVLKGMSQGRLYNIDYRQISAIFTPLFEQGAKEPHECPLCRKPYAKRQPLLMHISNIHTNFTAFCSKCGHWIVTRASCTKHKCSNFKRQKSSVNR